MIRFSSHLTQHVFENLVKLKIISLQHRFWDPQTSLMRLLLMLASCCAPLCWHLPHAMHAQARIRTMIMRILQISVRAWAGARLSTTTLDALMALLERAADPLPGPPAAGLGSRLTGPFVQYPLVPVHARGYGAGSTEWLSQATL